jgi:hypothetical protein
VVGEAPNLAARLQALAAPDSVLIASTRAALWALPLPSVNLVRTSGSRSAGGSGKGAPGGRSRILCSRSSLSRTAIRQLLVLASNPKNLNRPPKR